jgi:DNA polymerase III subunit alpha
MSKYKEYDNWKNAVEDETADKYMFVNIATSGLPDRAPGGYHDFKKTKHYDRCRIVQLVWTVTDSDGNVISSKNYIIKPDNFNIHREASKLHGITKDIAYAKGIDMNKVFKEFLKDIQTCELLIAHNIEFDYNVLMSELFRNKQKDLMFIVKFIKKMCTGSATKSLLKLPTKSAYDDYKMPKLTELYKWCFKENIGKYDVQGNIDALVKIYSHLKQKYNMTKA